MKSSENLSKKRGVEPAGSSVVASIRMPRGLSLQIKAIVEAEGSDQTTVLLRLIEQGLLRESVTELVTDATTRWRALVMDYEVYSEVLGDMSERLKSIEGLLKK